MKTPVTHDQMIKMFDTQQVAILEITRANAKAINAKTIQETDRIDLKLDSVIKHQKGQNGKVEKNAKAIVLNNETTEKVDRFSSNVKWYAFGLFAFCYAVCWIYNTFNLEEIVLKLIHKI